MSTIYDVVYNDEHCYIIICSGIYDHISDIIVNNVSISFTKTICGHKHTTIYTTIPSDFFPSLYLSLSDEKTSILYSVSRYPSFPNEIIMTTCVRHEDNIIRQWITYHQLLGVSRFIIYDNSNTRHSIEFLPSTQTTSNLEKVLENEIKSGIVILIKWLYKYKFQQAQINHCLYTFRTSKLIGFMDVDEYVNLQHVSTIHELEKKYGNKIGFMLRNKEFHNPNYQSEEQYDFLRITDCTKFATIYHNKMFIKPTHNIILSVHKVTKGSTPITISSDEAYFNHYIFLNKKYRGRTKVEYEDNTILRLAQQLIYNDEKLICVSMLCY